MAVLVEPAAVAGGPGTELKKLLRVLGFATCGRCAERAAEMDAKGCDWCAENLSTILGWLREVKLPFFETGARLLIRRAIARAR